MGTPVHGVLVVHIINTMQPTRETHVQVLYAAMRSCRQASVTAGGACTCRVLAKWACLGSASGEKNHLASCPASKGPNISPFEGDQYCQTAPSGGVSASVVILPPGDPIQDQI